VLGSQAIGAFFVFLLTTFMTGKTATLTHSDLFSFGFIGLSAPNA